MKNSNDKKQKNEADLLSLSPITQKIMIDNEVRANKAVSIILFAFAIGLLATDYFIASSAQPEARLILALIIVFLALVSAAGGLVGILAKKYYSWMKYFLVFIVVFSLYTVSFLLGNDYDLTLIVPLILSCCYSSKKFSLRTGIFFGIYFLIGDVVSIFTKSYSDLNILIFNEGVMVDLSDPFSRFAMSVDDIDATATFKNFIMSYGIFRFSTYVILCFSSYLICSISEKNLIKQAEVIESQMRLKEEMNLAKDLQANSLPINFEDIKKKCKGIDIFGLLIGSNDIAGDLYDFFLVDKDHLCFMIGDVSARGVKATLFMHTIKESVEEKAKQGLSPKRIFELVNNEVCKEEQGLFVTMWLGILDLNTKSLVYSNAGQNNPYISEDGKFSSVRNATSSLFLGGIENSTYEDKEIELKVNQKIFLYTDSVVETQNSNKEMFGDNRLVSFLDEHYFNNVEDIINGVKAEIESFQDNQNNEDDITMLALEIKE